MAEGVEQYGRDENPLPQCGAEVDGLRCLLDEGHARMGFSPSHKAIVKGRLRNSSNWNGARVVVWDV
jgi:hypothetical protein